MFFDYTLVRSDRKRLGIVIDRNSDVTVRAPVGYDEEKILDFIESKKPWIFRKLYKKSQLKLPDYSYKAGSSVLYKGRNYKIKYVENQDEEIAFHSKFLIRKDLKSHTNKIINHWLKQQADHYLNDLVEEYSKKIGVNYKNIKIYSPAYRWGACSSDGNLYFNWKIIRAPKKVIAYLVIHELTHLLVPNHSQKFWTKVSIQQPEYLKNVKWLKDNGAELMRD